jgi:hypothetical protein
MLSQMSKAHIYLDSNSRDKGIRVYTYKDISFETELAGTQFMLSQDGVGLILPRGFLPDFCRMIISACGHSPDKGLLSDPRRPESTCEISAVKGNCLTIKSSGKWQLPNGEGASSVCIPNLLGQLLCRDISMALLGTAWEQIPLQSETDIERTNREPAPSRSIFEMLFSWLPKSSSQTRQA